MSYVDPTQNPQDPNAPNGQPPTTSGGGDAGIVTGGGVGGSSAASSGAAPSAPATPSSSGSWTNLDSYLGANADQGGKVGGDIASNVSAQGSKAQGDIGNLNNSYNSAVDANTTNADQGVVDSSLAAAKSGNALTPDQIGAFQKQSQASYNGPTDVTKDANYGQAQNDTSQAAQAVAQTQSESGRNVLLNNQYKNASQNGYNQGENNLDQMLLENSAGGQQALQPLAQQWGGLANSLSGSVTAGAQRAKDAQATDAATSANAMGAVNGREQQVIGDVNAAVPVAQQQYKDNYKSLMDTINAAQTPVRTSENFDQDTMQKLGLQSGDHLWNLDLSKYMNPYADTMFSQQNVANGQQYAEYNALNQLAGTNNTLLNNPASAGTAPTTPFGQANLQADIAASAQNWDKQQATGTFASPVYTNSQGAIISSKDGLGSIAGQSNQQINMAQAAELQKYYNNAANYNNPQAVAKGQADSASLQQLIDQFKNQSGVNNIVNPSTFVGGRRGPA
jgi:hypothetical protein